MNQDSPDAEPKCVGVVSLTISDKTGGKLAGIVPSCFFVRMMIDELLRSVPREE